MLGLSDRAGLWHRRRVLLLAAAVVLFAASLGCGVAPPEAVPQVDVVPHRVEPTPPSAPSDAAPPESKPGRLRREPLRFLPTRRPAWSTALDHPDDLEFAAVDHGVLFYVLDVHTARRIPHGLTQGRLTRVPGLDPLPVNWHDHTWTEYFGRWPDALWRTGDSRDERSSVVERWNGRDWRAMHPFAEACVVRQRGHTWDGGVLQLRDACTGTESPPYTLHAVTPAGVTAIGPPLDEPPEFALTTPEALYLVLRRSVPGTPRTEQLVRRHGCPAPYDCPASEELTFAGLPGLLPWLDPSWNRVSSWLALRDGIVLVLQREGEFGESHLVSHLGGAWRDESAPGRVTALLAAEHADLVVVQTPLGDPLLGADVIWGESAWPRGNTVWIHPRTTGGWRPVALPPALDEAWGVQIAVDDRALWVGGYLYDSRRSWIYTTPLADLQAEEEPPSPP